MCEMQYFGEYVLGWKGPGNLKADKGTIVHKILEILAIIKLNQQKNLPVIPDTPYLIQDEACGLIDINNFDLHDICEKVFNYYAKIKDQPWTDKDFRDCELWANKAIDFNGGAFNPLNMNIVAPEQHFDLVIDEPWAHYDYVLDGKKIEGQLGLKGTIDLITSPMEGTYEIVDWKTGRRLNWATGEEKTHEKLMSDPQLMMYFLAASKLYPDIENIIVTIDFINDGGPFSLCYSKSDIPRTLDMLKEKFEYIKATKIPKQSKSWKCTKFCYFGKNTFTGTEIKPIIVFRNGQVCSKGQTMTMCEQMNFELYKKGMDKTVKEYKAPDHKIDFYQNPGE